MSDQKNQEYFVTCQRYEAHPVTFVMNTKATAIKKAQEMSRHNLYEYISVKSNGEMVYDLCGQAHRLFIVKGTQNITHEQDHYAEYTTLTRAKKAARKLKRTHRSVKIMNEAYQTLSTYN